MGYRDETKGYYFLHDLLSHEFFVSRNFVFYANIFHFTNNVTLASNQYNLYIIDNFPTTPPIEVIHRVTTILNLLFQPCLNLQDIPQGP